MITIDKSKYWWIYRDTVQRLTTWTRLILGGEPYQVIITTPDEEENYAQRFGCNYHDPINKVISVDATFAKDQPAAVQYRMTQMLLSHEAAHAMFTRGWPEDRLLGNVTNSLEDERIERLLLARYKGLTQLYASMQEIVFNDHKIIKFFGSDSANDTGFKYLNLMHNWRFAHRMMNEADFLMLCMEDYGKFNLSLWNSIRELAEKAWDAPDTTTVTGHAQEIIDLLEFEEPSNYVIDEKFKEILRMLDLLASLEEAGADLNEATLEETPEGDPDIGIGIPSPETKEHSHGAGLSERISSPKAYLELFNSLQPEINTLAQSIRKPKQKTSVISHEWLGRYDYRREQRDPERPMKLEIKDQEDYPDLAVEIVVDRSGSMRGEDQAVRIALMTIYPAMHLAELPIGVTYAGASRNTYTPEKDNFPICASGDPISEDVMAYLAGYEGLTGCELMSWAMETAADNLRNVRARNKLMIVIHDGQPVYRGIANDRDRSKEMVQKHAHEDIIHLGIYLGNDERDIIDLTDIFGGRDNLLVERNARNLGEILGRRIFNLTN